MEEEIGALRRTQDVFTHTATMATVPSRMEEDLGAQERHATLYRFHFTCNSLRMIIDNGLDSRRSGVTASQLNPSSWTVPRMEYRKIETLSI